MLAVLLFLHCSESGRKIKLLEQKSVVLLHLRLSKLEEVVSSNVTYFITSSKNDVSN